MKKNLPESDQPACFIRWAGNKMKRCHKCLEELEIKIPVGRKDVCPACGSDLRCCLNCTFHAPGVYNDCKEPQAERAIEKERSNFCDYFRFRDGACGLQRDSIGDSRAKLQSLFR